ncbi:hypothetical protein [Chryseobacterium sp. MFBS3-17]|uniref:hypothetical protein n=1 Tax=Chryseobacterium sp. MFBS3-17 TaxID=2886689 RepID=UPI001D0DCDC8|nr:hypothetical protein [Chryseobacterium sp. MFBS3-17]MCC2590432.1 hypothetical protein [Chryseobacterium sp. MFBS3-17]
MKNFDIENLERQNIYTVPEDSFARMQENVLRNITTHQAPVIDLQGKKKTFQWWYAAAAAIALFFGGAYLLTDSAETIEHQAANNQPKALINVNEGGTQLADAKTVTPATQNYESLNRDLTIAEKEHQTKRKGGAISAPAGKSTSSFVNSQKMDEQVELILQEFSAEDIAVLSQNVEQDIYLDLYY